MKGSHSFNDTAESASDASLRLWNFLGEYEAICETALGESWPKGGLFDEKKPRVENLVTLAH
jgi:hypothetical protein